MCGKDQGNCLICMSTHICAKKVKNKNYINGPTVILFLTFKNRQTGAVTETFKTPYTPQHKIGGTLPVNYFYSLKGGHPILFYPSSTHI